MSPSNECKVDNVTYILCMLSGTPSCGCFKFIIKWWNVYPWTLKYVK